MAIYALSSGISSITLKYSGTYPLMEFLAQYFGLRQRFKIQCNVIAFGFLKK